MALVLIVSVIHVVRITIISEVSPLSSLVEARLVNPVIFVFIAGTNIQNAVLILRAQSSLAMKADIINVHPPPFLWDGGRPELSLANWPLVLLHYCDGEVDVVEGSLGGNLVVGDLVADTKWNVYRKNKVERAHKGKEKKCW